MSHSYLFIILHTKTTIITSRIFKRDLNIKEKRGDHYMIFQQVSSYRTTQFQLTLTEREHNLIPKLKNYSSLYLNYFLQHLHNT